MTREEAIKIAQKASRSEPPFWERETAGAIVDMVVALGLLKLDGSRSAMERAAEALDAHGQDRLVLRTIANAGLRIVEDDCDPLIDPRLAHGSGALVGGLK